MADRVLVTGAGGFVGRALVPVLRTNGWEVREAARSPRPGAIAVGEIDATTDWTAAVGDCNAIVHLAARVHHRSKAAASDLNDYRRTNRDATLRLAEAAAHVGVRRFVFVSTVKVNGEGRETAYQSDDLPAPQGAYAVSKHEAEQGLWEIAARTGLQVVILRPPLVYGPGVAGNFRKLVDLVSGGIPLPLGSVRNRRSLVGVTNLSSAIGHVLRHPAAQGKTWLLSDQHDLSTPELIQHIAAAAGRRALLMPFPTRLLRVASRFVGRQRIYDQLAGSLTVDSTPFTLELGWTPPLEVAQQLDAMMKSVRQP